MMAIMMMITTTTTTTTTIQWQYVDRLCEKVSFRTTLTRVNGLEMTHFERM